MTKYIMSQEEFESLDELIQVSKLNYLSIHQNKELGDCFYDSDDGIFLTLKEGLSIIKESGALENALQSHSIDEEKIQIIKNLFKKKGKKDYEI